MKKYTKEELFSKIDIISEPAQECLWELLCHKFYNYPIKYDETPEIIELVSCGLIRKATQKNDFEEFTTSELENLLSFSGFKIENETNKNYLIEQIFEIREQIFQNFIPILNFNLQRNAFSYLCKHLGREVE